MTGSLLLLASAFLHALWNALLKQSHTKLPLLFGISVVGAIASGAVSLFTGWGDVGRWVWYGIGAGAFEGLYFLSLAHALDKNELGRAYLVMRGGSLVLVWLISAIGMGERVGVAQLAGIGLVLAGLFCVRPRLKRKEAVRSRRVFVGDAWIFASALCIAGYHIAYGVGLRQGAPSIPLFGLSMGVAAPLVALGIWVRRPRRLRRPVRPLSSGLVTPGLGVEIMLAGAIATGSFWLFLAALAQAPAGQAMTLRTTSVVFAQVFGALLGERISRSQWVGAGLVLVGALAL